MQGFIWSYDYKVDGKKKTITSVDLNKLKEKIRNKGLDWIVVNEEQAKLSLGGMLLND